MCGIAGIYSKSPADKSIRAMLQILRHRGPDDEGYIAYSLLDDSLDELVGDDSKVSGKHIETFQTPANLFLGHRRLSIIDISTAGHQPMTDSGRSLWITYNGEIYNYLELKDELISLGYTFKTRTDTEVVLAAYAEWGPSCVEKFNGMWAFVIFDKRNRKLFGSRDRFGVKPLYYYLDSKIFSFASEIKAILVLPQYEKSINNEAVYDYLVRGIEEGDEQSFFKGIFELLPSHNFEYDCSTGQFKTSKYYDLAFNDSWEQFSSGKYSDHIEQVRELIFNSIKIRLRSDVTIGTCLSGGVDSSSIVCVINELMKQQEIEQIGMKQKVFTASYDGRDIDESKWAAVVVNSTRTSWHRTFPSATDLMNDLEDLVRLQDIPFGSTSIYAQYRVMKLAKENGVKVLLDGQGGDEVFTGYLAYYRALFMEMVKNAEFAAVMNNISQLKNAPITLKGLFFSVGKQYALQSIPYCFRRLLKHVFRSRSSYFNAEFIDHYSYRDLNATIPQTVNGTLHQFMTGGYLKTLLRYEDRNSMHFSIESRTPFADDVNLIECMFRIPSVYKMHNCWSKSLLRDSMKDIIPDQIRTRRDKIGFSTPEQYWLNESKHHLKEYITDNVSDYFNLTKIHQDWDTLFESKKPGMNNFIWKLLNYSMFKTIHRL